MENEENKEQFMICCHLIEKLIFIQKMSLKKFIQDIPYEKFHSISISCGF